MPFETDGYLAPEVGHWIDQHRKQYAQWFELAGRFNREGHSLVEGLHIGVENGQQVLSAALYVRSLEFFQGVILMAERGMMNQAKTLFRSQMEATFSLRAITSSEEVMKEYIAADAHQRLKALKKVRNNPTAFRAVLADGDGHDVETLIAEVEEEIRQNKPRKVEVAYLAEKADMKAFYDTAYVLFSGTVHSAVRDLEHYLEVDDQENVVGMRWGPLTEDADRIVMSAIETLTYAFDAIEKTFGLNPEARQALIEEFRRLGQEMDQERKDRSNKNMESTR